MHLLTKFISLKKKAIHLVLIVISLSMFFSCKSSEKQKSINSSDTIAAMAAPKDTSISHATQGSPIKSEDDKLLLSGTDYYFSNDTLCQNLSIKEAVKNRKLTIPEKIEFKLLLRDKKSKMSDKTFKGVAKLSSSEESFYDNLEKDGGDYFAADYVLKTQNYTIKIRLDIDKYEACVVSIAKANAILGEYSKYLKAFPNEGVMKKGRCD